MRVSRAFLIVSAVGLSAAAQETKKQAADELKGSWSAVSMAVGEQLAPAELVMNFKTTFDGRTYINEVSKAVIEQGEYKVDTSQSPKTIDFDIKKGDDQGKRQLAVYKIEEDKLTMVMSQPGSNDRPKSFEVGPGVPVLKLVLQRSKP